jgi:superfamily II DNA or RNA helicase
MIVNFKKNSKNGQILSDIDTLNLIREYFSVPNKAFGRRNNRFSQRRLYSITQSGKFEIGMLKNIIQFLDLNQIKYSIDDELLKSINPVIGNIQIKTFKNLIYREHQQKSIELALKNGRGLVIIPTAGGKTLIMAGIIESIRKSLNQPDALAMVLVPSIQLVEQTSKDFEEYGIEKVTKWSGNNKLDDSATTIIAGNQFLLSDKTDLSILSNVKILLVDEAHVVRKNNEINKIFNLINTDYIFGFTGTLPSTPLDEWNIIGKIGPILYEEKTKDLEIKKYVSNFKIIVLNINHKNPPRFTPNPLNPTEAYSNEIDYLMNNQRRNEIIAKIAHKIKNNTIIMVDRIDHGINLENELKKMCGDEKLIYFIRGSTEMEEREQIRKLMEQKSNVVAVAVSKIFSTGINIPNLHNIIFASAGKAKIKIMQSIGRALRLHPTKQMASIIDIADNTKYGITHLKERTELYKKENYNYEKKEI